MVTVSELLLSFILPFLLVWVSFPGRGPDQSDPVRYLLSQGNQGLDQDWKGSHKQLATLSLSFHSALLWSVAFTAVIPLWQGHTAE